MANTYSYAPYNGNNAPEYNSQGNAANGRTGSNTPGALANREQQRSSGGGPPSGQNPYADIVTQIQNGRSGGTAVTPWSAYGAQRSANGLTAAPTSAPANAAPYAAVTNAITQNRDTGGGDLQDGYGGGSGGGNGNGGGTGGGGTTPPATVTPFNRYHGHENPSNGVPGVIPANTPTYDDDVKRYAANPGYEWLMDPQYHGIVAEFRNQAAAQNWNTTDPNAPDYMDITDYLASRVPGHTQPSRGRHGYDTYNYVKGPDGQLVPRQFSQGAPEGNTGPQFNPEGTVDHFGPNHEALDQGGHQLMDSQGRPMYAHGYGPTGADAGYDQVKPPAPAPPGAPPGSPPSDPGNPANVAPQGAAGPPPGSPAGGMPPVSGIGGVPGAPPQSGGTELDRLAKLFGPQFNSESDRLNRGLTSQFANNYGFNMGGTADAMGRANSELAADQGQRLSTQAFTADQSAMDRALAKYQTDTTTGSQRAIADVNAEVDRLKITTDDQLQRWLNDPNNPTLQKYSIDKNDLLQRYQTAAAGQANAGGNVNRAALQSALGGVMSNLNNQNQGLERDRLAMENQWQGQTYNLGLANLGQQQYQYNNVPLSQLLQMYMQMSPEQLSLSGMGGIQWPNWLMPQGSHP